MPPGDLSCIKEKMMKFRVILVCTLLLLAATPSFALPLCAHCNEWNVCESAQGDIDHCFVSGGVCDTDAKRCSPPLQQSTVLADWTVASIEISRPAPDPRTSATAVAATKVATPAPQTTELK
jgi:hypothetical protein